MKVRELVTQLGFKVNDEQAKNAEKKIKKMAGAMKLSLAAVGVAFVALGKKAVSAAATMESIATQFEVMTGSAEKANALMAELNQFAATTPFALEDLATGTQNLMAFGLEAKESVEAMRMLGDTAGGDVEKLKGITLAYGKAMAKGKAQTEELNMMTERGIPILGTLAEMYGVTKQGVLDMAADSMIAASDVTKAFSIITSEGGMFFEGMKKQSLTFNGIMSTLSDNITLRFASIGAGVIPQLKEIATTITAMFQGGFGDSIEALLKPLFQVVASLMPILLNVFNLVAPILGLVGDIVAVVLPALDLINFLLQPIFDLLMGSLVPLIARFSSIFKFIADYLVLFVGIIKLIYNKFVKPIVDVYLKLMSAYFSAFQKVLDKILGFLMQIYNIVYTIVSTAVIIISFLLNWVIAKLASILTTLWENIVAFFANLGTIISDFFSKIGAGIANAWALLLEKVPWIQEVLNKISTFISSLWDGMISGFMVAWDVIRKGLNGMITAMNLMPGVDVPLLGAGGAAVSGGSSKNPTQTINIQSNVKVGGGGGADPSAAKQGIVASGEAIFGEQLRAILVGGAY